MQFVLGSRNNNKTNSMYFRKLLVDIFPETCFATPIFKQDLVSMCALGSWFCSGQH